jgi:eukaryotic-like serine/threonine-protein kinase
VYTPPGRRLDSHARAQLAALVVDSLVRTSRPDADLTLTAADRPGAPALPVLEVAAGTTIGRYLVERRLGAGGMGVVYAARDTELARDIALKLVRPRAELDVVQARLRREAQAMARLSHPNVVPVFDIGTHQGQLFLAMELVTGDTLRSWVGSPRPWPDVVALFVKAGRGLEAAHAAGLLHRDFKPDNVMIGPGDVPRITDFGLAHEFDAEAAATEPPTSAGGELAQVTASGGIAGTPAYMAPEQLLGHPGGPRADQFSFCVTLFEVLYGTRPFRTDAPSGDALIAEIRVGRIGKPALARGVPGWLHAALVRGLAFPAEQRWSSMRALVDALERGHRRRRRPRVIGLAAILGILTAGGLVVARARLAPARCADVATKANDGVTILVCQDEYARTNDPRVGIELAKALRRTGKLREAATLATELLATPARADALYTLGKVAITEERRDDAERALRLASGLHRDQQQWGQAAADLQALAEFSNDVVDKLVGFDQAASDARRGDDARIEAFCHLAAAEVLSQIDARSGALGELARAEPLLSRPTDLVQLALTRGNVYQNLGDDALAAAAFERARAGSEVVTTARFARSAGLNLVYSLAEAGRLDDATRQLQAVSALDPDDRHLAVRLALEARIVRHRGDLAGAAGLVERAIAATDRDATDDLLERDVERAEIALARGELATAEQSARRAIGHLEALRSTHPPVELRSWLMTDRRAPYELLFATLARRGDAPGALAVLDRYRGLGVLAGLLHGDGGGAPPAGPAFPAAELARWFPRLGTSALATPASEAAIRDAVRTASLLVLVVAHDELWRITAEGGRLEVAQVGPLAALGPRLDQLRAAPDDRAIAAALGDLLVPVALARPTDQALHVVLDEPLAWLPVAALRVGGRRLIAARPVVRVARPSALGCAARPAGPPHVVRNGVTRASLFDVARGDLLDVEVPIERDALGDALVLQEGRVRALEIAGHRGVAARVVLATPDAGATGSTALAMAFLAAGADQVIAAVRPVPRATAERLTEQLVRADGTDLVRALAHLQAAEDENDAWLGFAAFGRATCTSP